MGVLIYYNKYTQTAGDPILPAVFFIYSILLLPFFTIRVINKQRLLFIKP